MWDFILETFGGVGDIVKMVFPFWREHDLQGHGSLFSDVVLCVFVRRSIPEAPKRDICW